MSPPTQIPREKLEEAARDCLTLCLMAYMGNHSERGALRGIREVLIPIVERLNAAKMDEVPK